MIDFHSHILPMVDDGAGSVEESLAMLRLSYEHGVEVMVSTSHFYADEDEPDSFLARRNSAFRLLKGAMKEDCLYPLVVLGAEVLYFPGISQAEGIRRLAIGCGGCILIEPPMARWTDTMLDEIAALGENFQVRPVVAHVDRYMELLRDNRLLHRVLERNLLVQVNTSYFLNPKTTRRAMRNLKEGKLHLIGTDCHNLTSRPPDLRAVLQKVREYKLEDAFRQLSRNAEELLKLGDYL